MEVFLIFAAVVIAVTALVALRWIYKRKMQVWLPAYLTGRLRKKEAAGRPVHILFCVADHYEPGHGGVDRKVWFDRVRAWAEGYPAFASRFVDSDGVHPRHTWFYPPHYYEEELFRSIVALCSGGYGDVEMHLHHNRMEPFPDTEYTLRKKITDCIELYSRMGVFTTTVDGAEKTAYAFIHGDWALDNGRVDEGFCGVNNELTILQETGCYADYTFPANRMESQPRKINSIYYARDDEDKPKSYDSGLDVEAGKTPPGGLMMVQGPLGLRWDGLRRVLPKVEDGEISSVNPATPERIDSWVRNGARVAGRPDWVVVKVHTHGAPEAEHDYLFGRSAEKMHRYLQDKYNDGEEYLLHYVTSRELFNIIKAAENSESGNPGEFRDYVLGMYRYNTESR